MPKYFRPGSRPLQARRNLSAAIIQRRWRARRSRTIQKLKRDVKRLKKSAEYKYRDSVQSISMSTSLAINDLGLGLINQGDGAHDREGATITLQSLKLRGYMNFGDAVNKYRIIVFKVLDVDHTMPGIQASDILETTGDWYNSFYKKNSNASFKIYKDIRGWLNKPGYDTTLAAYNATANPTHRDFTCNLKFKTGLKVKYPTATGSATLPNTNGFFILIMGDSFLADHPDVNFVCRLTWTE